VEKREEVLEKAMISQPMAGLTDFEIEDVKSNMKRRWPTGWRSSTNKGETL